MPRPTKCRRVCRFPQIQEFYPMQGVEEPQIVVMTVDEYETIRLIDKEGLSQEQCSERMQVARTTAQKIYDSARKKLAEVLVEGYALRIDGGEYRLCDGTASVCEFKECLKRQIREKYVEKKGEMKTMRIAVTYENGQIFQHFGHTEQFKVYEIADGKIVASEVVGTNGSGHGALADVLHALNAETLICGGIGAGAQNALAAIGIKLYGGVSGDADAAVEAFLKGELDYNPDVKCSHHGEHHHENHQCGDHGCGSEHHCAH